ncbi:MAG: dockerin type I repeat-containing protein, partial [Muribaculaceae bacterium]|nr:dockerin type I repeat-containing protein [Muribaculaceae bacterium]
VGYFLIQDNWFNSEYPVEIYLTDGANLKMEEAGNYTIRVRKLIPTKGDRVNSMEQLAMFVTKNTVVAGDVNGDGEITSADITALYSFLLSGDDADIVHGDQDNDGQITSSDITAVYSIILGSK